MPLPRARQVRNIEVPIADAYPEGRVEGRVSISNEPRLISRPHEWPRRYVYPQWAGVNEQGQNLYLMPYPPERRGDRPISWEYIRAVARPTIYAGEAIIMED